MPGLDDFKGVNRRPEITCPIQVSYMLTVRPLCQNSSFSINERSEDCPIMQFVRTLFHYIVYIVVVGLM